MTEIANLLVAAAVEYRLKYQNIIYSITRRNNHGYFLPNNEWAVCFSFGTMNPWYAYYSDEDGWTAKYKCYTPLDSAEDAVAVARITINNMKSKGKWDDSTRTY